MKRNAEMRNQRKESFLSFVTNLNVLKILFMNLRKENHQDLFRASIKKIVKKVFFSFEKFSWKTLPLKMG